MYKMWYLDCLWVPPKSNSILLALRIMNHIRSYNRTVQVRRVFVPAKVATDWVPTFEFSVHRTDPGLLDKVTVFIPYLMVRNPVMSWAAMIGQWFWFRSVEVLRCDSEMLASFVHVYPVVAIDTEMGEGGHYEYKFSIAYNPSISFYIHNILRAFGTFRLRSEYSSLQFRNWRTWTRSCKPQTYTYFLLRTYWADPGT